jgi:hypothetical protein
MRCLDGGKRPLKIGDRQRTPAASIAPQGSARDCHCASQWPPRTTDSSNRRSQLTQRRRCSPGLPSRACTYKRTACICCSQYLRTPRSAPFDACGTARPRSAPQNLSPTFGAGRRGGADLRVCQRLWINPRAARPSGPSAARRCSDDSNKTPICREFLGWWLTRPASPSLFERDSVSVENGRFAGI